MNQIMRLRRKATGDHGIKDKNNGYGHEQAFVNIIERYGTLHEAQLLPRSFGDGSLVKGQVEPHAVKQLIENFPTVVRAVTSGKVPLKPHTVLHPKLPDQDKVKKIFKTIESKDERLELNLYIVGEGAEDDAQGKPEARANDEARLLARLRLARLHPRAARLDGAGRAQARPRAGGARPRQLLRRRRDRRAQPGAGRHAQRAHVRDGPGRGRRGGHDEHLLHLPGRAEGVPGAPRRRLRLPRARQQPPARRGPHLRERRRLVEQELPLAAGRGDRHRQAGQEGRAPARGPADRAVLRLLHRPPHRAPGLRTSTPTATSTSTS